MNDAIETHVSPMNPPPTITAAGSAVWRASASDWVGPSIQCWRIELGNVVQCLWRKLPMTDLPDPYSAFL